MDNGTNQMWKEEIEHRHQVLHCALFASFPIKGLSCLGGGGQIQKPRIVRGKWRVMFTGKAWAERWDTGIWIHCKHRCHVTALSFHLAIYFSTQSEQGVVVGSLVSTYKNFPHRCGKFLVLRMNPSLPGIVTAAQVCHLVNVIIMTHRKARQLTTLCVVGSLVRGRWILVLPMENPTIAQRPRQAPDSECKKPQSPAMNVCVTLQL